MSDFPNHWHPQTLVVKMGGLHWVPINDVVDGVPCASMSGEEVYELMGISDNRHLWRECDDGMGDELIRKSADVRYKIFNGDRFYAAGKVINGN